MWNELVQCWWCTQEIIAPNVRWTIVINENVKNVLDLWKIISEDQLSTKSAKISPTIFTIIRRENLNLLKLLTGHRKSYLMWRKILDIFQSIIILIFKISYPCWQTPPHFAWGGKMLSIYPYCTQSASYVMVDCMLMEIHQLYRLDDPGEDN